MGAGNYSLLYTATEGATITHGDRNAEHQNHINNHNFVALDDYSTSLAQMQAVTDPYPASAESLATSGSGELERLRYVIKQITGEAQWYIDPDVDLATIASTYATTASVVAAVPPGVIYPYAGSAAPTGFLLCYGQAISRSTYSALFAILSTTYGVGDGSTTFNIPDLRGRIPLGADNMGGSSANRVTATEADNLGQSSGAETHTLVTAEMPAHTHTERYYTGAGATTGISDNVSKDAITTGPATASTGGDGAHNNMQPYLTLNYIIKT